MALSSDPVAQVLWWYDTSGKREQIFSMASLTVTCSGLKPDVSMIPTLRVAEKALVFR